MKKTSAALGPTARALEDVARRESKIAEILQLFEPFSSTMNGPFDCSNTRAAFARASEGDKKKLPWAPESLDWADWMMNVHMPAIETRIMPEMDKRLKKEPKPLAAHATLVSLVDEMAERHDLGAGAAANDRRGTDAHDVPGREAAVDLRGGAPVGAGGREGRSRGPLARRTTRTGPSPTSGSCVPGRPRCRSIRRSMRSAWAGVLAESGARVVVWDDTVKARGEVAAAYPQLAALEVVALTDLAEDAALGRRRGAGGLGVARRRREPHLHERHHRAAEGRDAHARELHVARGRARADLPALAGATRCSASCRSTTRSSSRAACSCPSRAGRASSTSDELTGDRIADGLRASRADGDGRRAGALAAARAAHPPAGGQRAGRSPARRSTWRER